MSASQSDYIIVGGGLAGSVVAARLYESDPSLSITVIEAGEDSQGNPFTVDPLACMGAHFTSIDWNYRTSPQAHLGGRTCYQGAAKVLGGGSATNYGTWTRGNRADYDDWAAAVGDERWSYEGMLPYFKKAETHFREDADEQHGYQGPIHLTTVSRAKRKYPLRESLLKGFERIGVRQLDDSNIGLLNGISELVENWKNGKRQIATDAYRLREKNVRILVDAMAKRVLIETNSTGKEKVATGVELVDGRILYASREVIVSCGTYHTPKLLLLSGIGPAEELDRLDISPHNAHLPVGQNFRDHYALYQFWKLREPERGLSMGSPLWTDEAYRLGLPLDWLVTTSTSSEAVRAALEQDGDTSHASLARDGRAHTETILVYAPAGAMFLEVDVPFDGTYIGTIVIGGLPTSSGTVTLSSTNPADPPVIDPNYYATETDRMTFRHGVRELMQVLLDTPEGRNIVSEGMEFSGSPSINMDSSDKEIDDYIRRNGTTMLHPSGTASMGKVVDSELRVKGIKSLRVIDASVFPGPICGHYQAAAYALAEQGADIIIAAS